MGSFLPKQYLLLEDKPIVCHSLEILLGHPEITECIVVCAPVFRPYFSNYPVTFADPGARRQDSLHSGLLKARHEWVCVHDAARPFITADLISTLIETGKNTQAAALAVPVKCTLKESDSDGFVSSTLNRKRIWEVQTPQFLSKSLLEEGFAFAKKHQITVTDDVSFVELIGHPVKLVQGSDYNIKITTPEDLILCRNINSLSLMTEQNM